MDNSFYVFGALIFIAVVLLVTGLYQLEQCARAGIGAGGASAARDVGRRPRGRAKHHDDQAAPAQ